MFLKRSQPRPPRPVAAKEDRKPTFAKPLRYFEMILEWSPDTKRDPRIQRLGFKAEGGLPEAFTSAIEFTRLCNSMYTQTLTERKQTFCRLIAVYEEKAFKDYAAEPLYKREEERKFIQKHIETAKKPALTGKTPKSVRVR